MTISVLISKKNVYIFVYQFVSEKKKGEKKREIERKCKECVFINLYLLMFIYVLI